MVIRQKFGAGVAWMAFGNWTEQAVNFIVFILLARLLDTEAFGLLAMASVAIVLAEFLVRESLTEYLIAAEAPGAEDFNAVFWLLLLLGAGLTASALMLSGPIARAYGHDEIAPLTVALSPTILMIAATAVPVAVLRREMAFRSLSLRAITGVIAGGLAGVGLALAGFGVWALIGQRLAQVLANIAVAWFAVPWRPGLRTSRAHLREAASFGGRVMALRASELAITQVPTVAIGAVLGPAATGLYSVAWRLIETASFLIVTPLRMAAQPAFAAMNRGGQGEAAHLLADISRLSGFLAFPAFAGIAALAGPLLHVLFGPGWEGAAWPLAILAAAGIYFCVEKVQMAFGLAAGQAGRLAFLGWAAVAVALPLGAAAAFLGPPVVAAAFVIALLAFAPARFALVAGQSGVPVRSLAGVHLVPAVLSAVMAAAVLAARAAVSLAPVWTVVLGVAIGVAVYAALTLAFQRDRLRLLLSFIRAPHPAADGPETS